MVGVASFITFQSRIFMGPWQIFFIVVCVAGGAALGLMPFLLEFRVHSRLFESEALESAISQIRNLDQIASQIGSATTQWREIQSGAENAAAVSREVIEKISAQAKSITDGMENVNDTERAALRLEIEKLRRAETEWLQALVRILDHVHALHQGALRSGQQNLIDQIGNFQNACRDAARRVGITPFSPSASEPFDPQRHQAVGGSQRDAAGSTIEEITATGYTYQGKLVRPALVRIGATNGEPRSSDREVADLP